MLSILLLSSLIFANKDLIRAKRTIGPHSQGGPLALPANIRLGWKLRIVTSPGLFGSGKKFYNKGSAGRVNDWSLNNVPQQQGTPTKREEG